METTDTELALLEKIHEAEQGSVRLTQRELAKSVGLSLGMTNALLKRCSERGWIFLTHLSTKSVRYGLSPEGAAEMARRVTGHFQRAARSADLYRDRIESFVLKAKAEGASTLVLSGSSEVDFLLEYSCERHGLAFIKSVDREKAEALGRREGVVLVRGGADALGPASALSVSSIMTGARN